ncbi:SCUBE1 [Symbiodinium necroappetens]|uniref:SCUBE1 protein n=1 Tax=Symbiodinium necroappetens TaxID=1628268 RepID=A0A812QJ33_9DINO|nr:SCUBE1 [Symbiodinium necroappetens]
MKEEEAEAEMAAALQAQIRSLEQAELSQMRQGAQLQLRLEAAQRQLQELAEGAEAQRQARVEHLQAEEVQAARRLQGELQLQLEALLRREKEAEALQRKEAARTQRLDEEVRYWKNCGLILRRKQAGDLEVPRESEAGPQVEMEIEALRAQAKELRIQIKEMERLAASGRAQEVDLIAKNQSMAHSISMAEAAAKASREKATSLRAELQEAKSSEELPQASGSLRPEEVEEGLGVEEVEYWRRKVDEKKAEVERATADQQRLRGTLRPSTEDRTLSQQFLTAFAMRLLGWLINFRLVAGDFAPWCQPDAGSCVGRLHRFEKRPAAPALPCFKEMRPVMQLADWDGDGDLDVLVGESRIIYKWSDSLHDVEAIGLLGATLSGIIDLAVVDWDGDRNLDLLLCSEMDGSARISLLRHSELPLMGAGVDDLTLLVGVNGSRCWGWQAVDFDEDGDVDLIVQQRYFERTSQAALVERAGQQSPISIFGGNIKAIADIDGDGRLEVVMKGSSATQASATFDERLFVADWNSDGLPDLMVVTLIFRGNGNDGGTLLCDMYVYYQHIVEADLLHNSVMNTFEDVDLGRNPREKKLSLVDWNKDGSLDLLVGWDRKQSLPELYESRRGRAHAVTSAFENVTATSFPSYYYNGYRLAAGDFDGDGEVDLLIASEADGRLHYHRQLSGRLQAEELWHPFSNITVKSYRQDVGRYQQRDFYHLVQPVFLDWDSDGDMDLLLGLPDGRFFEQLVDGSLKEWPLERSPVRNALVELEELDTASYDIRMEMMKASWSFVDCDADGDLDMLRLSFYYSYGNGGPTWNPRLQACEHDSTGKLRCDDDFPCLGTNLSNFLTGAGAVGQVVSFDVGDVTDGNLKLIAAHEGSNLAVLWSAGFCVPEVPCHAKGLCTSGQKDCSCVSGHNLSDCSGCQQDFYSMPGQLGHLHSCIACPGADGKTCHGRGFCFDDALAKQVPQESTAALTATGNGTCHCLEVHFFGSDEAGRSSCIDGICPAGTEEKDGRCDPCSAGAASVAGDMCKKCLPGKYSLSGSASCSKCTAGTISEASGASACEACPAGRYELHQQFCQECSPGFISVRNSSYCTKCPAGFMAPESGSSSCVPGAGGFFSEEGSAQCQECSPGFISVPNSSYCSQCPAGSMAPKSGSSTCIPCAGGSFADTGSAKCQECSPGFISVPNSSYCTKCPAGFMAPESGSSSCVPCAGGFFSEDGSAQCQECSPGFISVPNSSHCSQCPAGSMAPKSGSSSCVPCAGGFFSNEGSSKCVACPSGKEAAHAKAAPQMKYHFPKVPGAHAVRDLSAQGQKLVLTSSMMHWVLPWTLPEVRFSGTDVPALDGRRFRLKTLNSFQLMLVDDSTELLPLDTSIGRIRLKPLRGFLVTGFWRCPLLVWCLLLVAAVLGLASQLRFALLLLVCGSGLGAGAVGFALRQRQDRTSLEKRCRQFFKQWPPVLQRCSRGPDRSITAGQLQDFLQFFETFVKERSMYYVCSNIVKPLTKPYQLSFAELVGPKTIRWFVSHFWGMPVHHFMDAVRKHALSDQEEWRESAYWICTFSNSQWHVKEELGNGHWEQSSFYLALTSPDCKGTAMVLDEGVQPLQRIWCLFEVYHTICLSRDGRSQGLLLCTSTGVLQEGKAGADVAVAVAERAKDLDTRSAKATSEEDRQMIHRLIEQMPGGFEAMNSFVRETIYYALEASHQHYESAFKKLVTEFAATHGALVSSTLPLPTLLTGRSTHGEFRSGTGNSKGW